MSVHRIFVPIADAVHDLDWLLGTAAGQCLLGRSHASQPRLRLRCLCHPARARQPELVVRLLQDHYYVARMPDTGHLHARVACPMFSEADSFSGSAGYEGAVRYRGDITEVKVEFPLHAGQAQAPNTASTRKVHGTVRRGSMSLAGLLSLLWTDAELNTWTPGEVLPWVRVRSRLQAAAQAIYLGKRRLADNLFVQGGAQEQEGQGGQGRESGWLPPGPMDEEAWDIYKLVLFKLGTVVETPHGGAWFKASSGESFLVTKPVLASLSHSYPRVMHALRNPKRDGSRGRSSVMCLGLTHWKMVRGVPHLSLLQGALMMTNWRAIPVESSYELLIADLLVEQGRRFTKPMRFDAATDEVFPDFLLSDVGVEQVPMEVYGVGGSPTYEARKQAKRKLYEASGFRFWEWTPPEPVPAFPEPAGRWRV